MFHEEFIHRFKKLCHTFGFSTERLRDRKVEAGSSSPELSWRWTERDEAVIFLSCRLAYNPNWGGFCGHPQMLVQAETDKEEQGPAAFIAPYLQQYRFARDHIFLSGDEKGAYFITLPASLLEGEVSRCKLLVDLARIARPGEGHKPAPVENSGPMRSFALSEAFLRDLHDRNFTWIHGRPIPIGRFLSSDLITFVDGGEARDRDSLFAATLRPHIREIVVHPNPNLRAAEIHLGQIFTRTVVALKAEYSRHKILCLAGLDIDMSTLIGRRGHCFIPWRAYLARQGEAMVFEQDDLLARLRDEARQGGRSIGTEPEIRRYGSR